MPAGYGACTTCLAGTTNVFLARCSVYACPTTHIAAAKIRTRTALAICERWFIRVKNRFPAIGSKAPRRPWATEKHDRLRKYIQASRGARAKFLPPNGTGGASYIELYSGAGRSLITGTSQIIDGSAIVAFKTARASGHPFSEMHVSDLEPQNSAALAQRIKALGGAASSYVGSADIVVDQVMNAINPHGLHLAFLDPFNLSQLPFAIIEKMLRVRRMDMIIHVRICSAISTNTPASAIQRSIILLLAGAMQLTRYSQWLHCARRLSSIGLRLSVRWERIPRLVSPSSSVRRTSVSIGWSS